MLNLEEVKVSGYERVAHATDQETGLNAFIAVHNSAVGKATGGQGVSLGGIRMRPYTEPNQLELADEIKQLSGFTEPELFGLQDVVRLSRGMTYKSAIAKTGLGGGKAVVIANPKDYPLGSPQREKLMESMGEAIHEFATRWPESIYVGAEDMNTKLADMKIIAGKTAHISGTGHDQFDGNPSPFTAEGVLAAIKGAVGDDLKGKRVAISGIGSVGGYLADMLHREGAVLTLADIDDKATNKAAELGSNTSVVPSGEIHKQQVDVYVPAAIGGVLNDITIPDIQAKFIVPVANNVLAEARHGKILHDKGIVYVPDYVANAGGIIAVGMEVGHKREGKSLTGQEISDTVTSKVGAAVKSVLKKSRDENIPTSEAADMVGDEIIAAAQQDAAQKGTSWAERSGKTLQQGLPIKRASGDGTNDLQRL